MKKEDQKRGKPKKKKEKRRRKIKGTSKLNRYTKSKMRKNQGNERDVGGNVDVLQKGVKYAWENRKEKNIIVPGPSVQHTKYFVVQ